MPPWEIDSYLRLLGDVPPEVKARTYRESRGPAALRQQVVEQVIPHQVALGANSEVAGDVDVESVADSVESLPVPFSTLRRQLRHDCSCDRVLRLGNRYFPDRSHRRPHKKG